jgi:hypothetical protein
MTAPRHRLDGIPLERLGEITKLLKERHLGAMSKVEAGFVPIPFDRYVDLHVQSNPSVDKVEFARRLRQAVDARKVGARCACGAFIWAIGWPRPAPPASRVLPARRGQIETTRSTRRWAFRPVESLDRRDALCANREFDLRRLNRGGVSARIFPFA